jgi:hypothetical protein
MQSPEWRLLYSGTEHERLAMELESLVSARVRRSYSRGYTFVILLIALSASAPSGGQTPTGTSDSNSMFRPLGSGYLQNNNSLLQPSQSEQASSPVDQQRQVIHETGEGASAGSRRFMTASRGVWRTLRIANELKAPVDQTLDALDGAYTAYSGEIPTTEEWIDPLRQHARALRDRLWGLKGLSRRAQPIG